MLPYCSLTLLLEDASTSAQGKKSDDLESEGSSATKTIEPQDAGTSSPPSGSIQLSKFRLTVFHLLPFPKRTKVPAKEALKMARKFAPRTVDFKVEIIDNEYLVGVQEGIELLKAIRKPWL
ncbi:MAG: hypothetical protein MMC33_008014 [Icmadophila ericetorum]|nr:hypothetical protein [Icmadophila ericetorum]